MSRFTKLGPVSVWGRLAPVSREFYLSPIDVVMQYVGLQENVQRYANLRRTVQPQCKARLESLKQFVLLLSRLFSSVG